MSARDTADKLRIAARCSTKPKRNFDDYATGCATKIRRERAHLVPKLRDLGLPLHEAADLISQSDAADRIALREAFDPSELEDDFVPASEIPS